MLILSFFQISNSQSLTIADYVAEGVEELDQQKLTPLLRLKYGAIQDANANLGQPEEIGLAFAGFQKYLYAEMVAYPPRAPDSDITAWGRSLRRVDSAQASGTRMRSNSAMRLRIFARSSRCSSISIGGNMLSA